MYRERQREREREKERKVETDMSPAKSQGPAALDVVELQWLPLRGAPGRVHEGAGFSEARWVAHRPGSHPYH